MTALAELASLFISALLSATLLPGSSELLLIALAERNQATMLLWATATAGNTLGSCITYAMGRGITAAASSRRARWLPSPERQAKAEATFARYGLWSLLLAWLPVVGDGLALVAGVLRVQPMLFTVLVGIGKGARYAVLLALLS